MEYFRCSRLSVIAGFMAVLAAATFAAGDACAKDGRRDASGHVLVSEWKRWEDAVKKDLPDSQREILEDILEKSEKRDLPWDFYSAAKACYYGVRLSNWKEAGATAGMIARKTGEYGNLVVTWNLASDRFPEVELPAISAILSARESLLGKKTDQFYQNVQDGWPGSRDIPESIVGRFGNDYEYMLWEVLGRALYLDPAAGSEPADSSITFAAAKKLLADYYGDRYPESAYLEYIGLHRIQDETGRIAALKDFIAKYHDKGIRFYAGADILVHRFDSLSRALAPSSGFKALRESCGAFEKARLAEKGDSGLLRDLETVKNLIGRLDFRRVTAWVQDRTDTLKVALQNVREADVRIYSYRGDIPHPDYLVPVPDAGTSGDKGRYGRWADSTLVHRERLDNSAGSYYVPDTLSIPLKGFDDRNYYIICEGGEVSAAFAYRKRSVSVACRYQDGQAAIYAADYITGRPVDTADVSIFRNDSLVTCRKNMPLDGFTPLSMPAGTEGRYSLECSFTDDGGIFRQSRRIYFVSSSSSREQVSSDDALSCLIFKNMAAFNPGDTLKYKAVLYESSDIRIPGAGNGWKRTGYRVWTGETPVVAELVDVSRNVVASDTLRVNEMGSVAGYFVLPEGGMNGRYTLRLGAGGKVLASSDLTVDEFVLPTFGITFDEDGCIYFPGDTVTVSGKIESYSGQSLAATAVTCSVSLWGEVTEEKTLPVADDGSFSVSFRSGDGKNSSGYFYHLVTVKAVDATGEMQEASCGVAVCDFDLYAEFGNESSSQIMQAGGRSGDAEAYSADVYRAVALEGNFAVVTFSLRNASYQPVDDGTVVYTVTHGGETVCRAEAVPGEKVWIDLSSWPSGTFRLKASAKVKDVEKVCIYDLVKTGEEDESLDKAFENFFKVIPSGDIKVQFGASAGPVWAVVQLFGGEDTCLHSGMVHLDGEKGKPGSLKTLSFPYMDSYPDVVRMEIFYFRNGQAYTFSHDFERKSRDLALPLTFSRFTDKAAPGEECLYEITAAPGAELVVSVFDMSSETFRHNTWNRLYPRKYPPYPRLDYMAGSSYGKGSSPAFSGALEALNIRGTALSDRLLSGTDGGYRKYASANVAAPVLEEAMVQTKVQDQAAAEASGLAVREDFASALAFYPFLKADGEGKATFSFTAGDKLSTYYVSVFAHDRETKNGIIRQEMLVTLPVTVSAAPPAYLYSGDRYVMKVSLSNVSGEDSEGTLSMFLYDGGDYADLTPSMVTNRPVKVPAGSASAMEFGMDVPRDIDTLGVKIVYMADDGVSDGIFVAVPVREPQQTLYESHSALLLSGMDRDSLYSAIRDRFVNVSGYGAEAREISIADMLRAAVPDQTGDVSPDALSVVRAYFASRIAASLGGTTDAEASGKLCGRLLSFQNAGGGFSWLKGGPSSPVVTAAVLEYLAVLDGKGLSPDVPELKTAAERAVRYLDRYCFSPDRLAGWAGGISLQQYLYIRSMYGDLPLEEKLSRKEMKAFSRQVKGYLYGKGTDPAGYILYKARRAGTVMNFLDGTGNDAFLVSVGLKKTRKMSSALDRYFVSLKEYAVAHPSGGIYYPNAVMPFRGLLENELYAHSLLCELMSRYGDSATADGIRLWIMVQKETQDWGDDPAYMLALSAVSEGSSALLASRVLVLTQKYMKPFGEIKASGNGLSVQCRYFVEDRSIEDGDIPGYREILPGEVLEVGDKVMAVYDLWSEENRSFVRLTAPRYAAMRPLDQLSGASGLVLRRLSVPGYMAFSPYSYREVKADRCNWYFDVLAEEKTRITEAMVVTQTGEFVSPVAELECMYAPHYRANAGSAARMYAEP